MADLPDSERCTATVHEPGRGIWTHRCRNRAKPGTNKCGAHTPKPQPLKAVASRRPRVRLRTSAHLTFVWDEGAGPMAAYRGGRQQVQWDSITITVDVVPGELPKVPQYVRSARGVRLRNDGTRGAVVQTDYARVEDIPGFAAEAAQTLREEFGHGDAR